MDRVIQNWPNLLYFSWGFVVIALNILIELLELNNDFKYFVHIGRVLKRGVAPLHTKMFVLILNFKLTIRNICFVPYNFI